MHMGSAVNFRIFSHASGLAASALHAMSRPTSLPMWMYLRGKPFLFTVYQTFVIPLPPLLLLPRARAYCDTP
jgi:hypothetical protein